MVALIARFFKVASRYLTLGQLFSLGWLGLKYLTKGYNLKRHVQSSVRSLSHDEKQYLMKAILGVASTILFEYITHRNSRKA